MVESGGEKWGKGVAFFLFPRGSEDCPERKSDVDGEKTGLGRIFPVLCGTLLLKGFDRINRLVAHAGFFLNGLGAGEFGVQLT